METAQMKNDFDKRKKREAQKRVFIENGIVCYEIIFPYFEVG
jgi:hypothetical protein